MPNVTSRPTQPASVEALVNRLFRKFALLYGAIWLDRYADLPMDAVKGEWCDSLRGMTTEQIRLAVEHTRQHVALPPTLPEFIGLCRQFRPTGQMLALISPREPMPPRVADFLREFVKKAKGADSAESASEHKRRIEANRARQIEAAKGRA